MRISLVIESDSLEGFLSELGQLQAISLQQPPAKVMAAVGKLASEPKPQDKAAGQKPHKQPEPEKAPAEPEKEEPTQPAPTEPPADEPQPAAAQAPVAAKKRGRRTKAEMQAAAAAAAPAATPAPPPANNKAAIFTRDDLTAVFREYVTKFGYSAAASDVSKLLQQNLGAGVRKSSDVADDHIAQAIAIVKAAVTENPFSRKVEANG